MSHKTTVGLRGSEKVDARTSLDTSYRLPSGDQCVFVLCEPIDTSLVFLFQQAFGIAGCSLLNLKCINEQLWIFIRKISGIKITRVPPRGKFVTWCPGCRSSNGRCDIVCSSAHKHTNIWTRPLRVRVCTKAFRGANKRISFSLSLLLLHFCCCCWTKKETIITRG